MRTMFLSIVALGIVGLAGRAEAVTVDHSTFNGKQVAFSFSVSKTIACGDGGTGTASAFGFISGAEQMFRSPGGRPSTSNGIFVEIDSFSTSCTGQSTGFLLGGISDGLNGPNPNLKSATLTGSTTICDFGDVQSCLAVALNATVTGTGSLNSSGGTTQTRTASGPGGPFTITISRGAFSSRSGSVTGTITIGGIVFTLDGSTADLVTNSSSQITVTKP